MDADGWRRKLISCNFGNVGEDLRKSIVEMAKRLKMSKKKCKLSCRLPSMQINPN